MCKTTLQDQVKGQGWDGVLGRVQGLCFGGSIGIGLAKVTQCGTQIPLPLPDPLPQSAPAPGRGGGGGGTCSQLLRSE